MLALTRSKHQTAWAKVPLPEIGPTDLLVEISLVGLCRTDLAVASGALAVDYPRILGHELVGHVVSIGHELGGFSVGDKVSADPVLRCGSCKRCQAGLVHACHHAKFMGVDCDGAIAEFVRLPGENAWKLPDAMDGRVAALLEPIAACAAVARAPIEPTELGIVDGSGRLARLTEMILSSYGFAGVDRQGDLSDSRFIDRYDFAVDTEGTRESIERLARCLRPGGKLILKSRPISPVPVDVRGLLPKELMICMTNYADFGEARRLLSDPAIDLKPLLGTVWTGHRRTKLFKLPDRMSDANTTSRPFAN